MEKPSQSLSLINRMGPCVPDGYRFVFPEDGFSVHAWTYYDWRELAIKHARANNITVPTAAAMEEQLCQTLPPGWCLHDDPNRARATTQLEWKDVLRAAQTFAEWIKSGVKTVDKAEANRRALICSRCYLNVPMSGCSVCQATVAKLAGMLPVTSHDSFLKSCAACGCVLRMKVHLPTSALDKEGDSLQEVYPESFCWRNKKSPNYRG